MATIPRISLFFLSILFFTLPPLYPGTQFEHITTKDGLSRDKIICILRDHIGFLWIGTEGGLNRYDGKNVKIYTHDPDDPYSISNSFAQDLLEDANRELWIATYGGGLNRYNRLTDTFEHYKHDPADSTSISDDFLLSIYEDRSGYLWIGTQGSGINKFDKKTGIFTHYRHDPDNPHSISHNINRTFLEDSGGVLWIGTDGGGLNRFDREAGKFTHYRNDPEDPGSLSHDFVLSIIEHPVGTLWLATYGGGLNKFDINNEKFTHFRHDPNNKNSLSHDIIQNMFQSPTDKNTLWIATDRGGLNKFDTKTERFTVYKHDPLELSSLSQDNLIPVYEDQQGLLWAGTRNKGLNKLNQEKLKIRHYKHKPDNPNSLSANSVTSLFEDEQEILWVGTGWGLNKLNRKNNTFTRYFHEPDNQNSLSDNNILQIAEDRDGMLWFGTLYGLNRFDRRKNKFFRYLHDPEDPHSLSHNIVMAIHIDEYNIMWIGTIGGGLNKIDLANQDLSDIRFTRIKHDPDDANSISHDHILSISEDRSGTIWLATQGGLNRYNREENNFTRYRHKPEDPNSLSKNFVISIYEDRNNRLWIGTEGGGLNRFDPQTETFSCYREKDGLPSDYVYGILEDSRGKLWLSTKNGLCKFDPQAVDENGDPLPSAFSNYYNTDGFQGNEYTYQAYLKNLNGEMFFGGSNGFNSFHPDSLKKNQSIPNIIFIDFQVMNQTFPLDTSITAIQKIKLPHDQNFFSFHFAALDLTAPQSNRYAYMLEGFDREWNYVQNRNFAYYTNVDPGKYKFRVKGANNDGLWNEEGRSLQIMITPPWWKTRWAYMLYFLLLAALLIGGRKYELKRLKLKHDLKMEHLNAEKLQEVAQLKSRFFANISHEFRTPLTLLLGPLNKLLAGDLAHNLRGNLMMMRRNAYRLLRLVNQLLDFSRLESGAMKLQASPGDIVSFIKGLMMSFQALAESKQIKYQFFSKKNQIILFFDRDKLEKIFYNLLSNAFIFTPEGGEISIRIKENSHEGDRGEIEIAVKDNGKGIKPEHLPHVFDRFYQADDSHTREQEGSGIGLALAKELVELHHGQIQVNSELNKGSEFTVILPLGKNHLTEEEIIEENTLISKSVPKKPEQLGPQLDNATYIDDQKSGKHKTIVLVVEDNSDMRAYISEYLQPHYRVQEATNGVEGIEKANDFIPDLIISDIMMPEMDGYQLCRELKQDEKTSHIPIILLTAKAARNDKIGGLETGADDYLIKPFDAQELLVRVRNLIQGRQKLRAYYQRAAFKSEDQPAGGDLINRIDSQFLERAVRIVEENLANADFNVKKFGYLIGMSGTQLRRKMNALIGQSPNKYIRTLRLNQAARLIREEMKTVSEAAYLSGFDSLSYFSKCFKKEFGKLPSEY